MVTTHVLGYPRIGARRALKFALEAYWRGELDEAALLEQGRQVCAAQWAAQAEAGLGRITVGDFAFYDHVLDTALLFGVVPERFAAGSGSALERAFRMARGRARPGDPWETQACELTKWFDTNYHYLVPELEVDQRFTVDAEPWLTRWRAAQGLGRPLKGVLLGPLTFLWLAKPAGTPFDRLALLEPLLEAYAEVLERFGAAGVEWLQIDEPILGLDLPDAWRAAFARAYGRLAEAPAPRLLLASYFGRLAENRELLLSLPVAGVHVDAVRGGDDLERVADGLRADQVLSAGVIEGRNVWRADLSAWLDRLAPLYARLGERLWLGSSCSLLHVPLDLEAETRLDPAIRPWLAFARQKLDELAVLARALTDGREAVAEALAAADAALAARRASPLTVDPAVRERLAGLRPEDARRARPYPQRAPLQRARLGLGPLPTTTIGSFPQTEAIRRARAEHRAGRMAEDAYRAFMREQIRDAVERQERLGLDVLVHGEPERNDMVEYFGGLLDGMLVTEHGWVQSYGSRCVKPPIVYGDVRRPGPMTVRLDPPTRSR
ncbi:MAG: hypothetical protein KatS3mg121_0574 [Gammaproteobacteria bacterium]|nr:MAG: hypothetical protein KatS3mg121_0574 [Gammaproteobacteria bacterium]